MRAKTIALIIFFLSTPFCLLARPESKGWRGIVPLHSTRADVERVFGRPNEELSAYSVLYQTANETVTIDYANGLRCGIGEKYSQWRVPRNTVEQISIHPTVGFSLVNMKIDPSRYKKRSGGHRPDDIYYIDEVNGESLRVFKGEVLDLKYFPAAADSHLRCSNLPKVEESNCEGLAPPAFDRYSGIPLDRERQRLDNFVIALMEEKNRTGYIIAYAGTRARTEEAKIAAQRAKEYLVGVRHFPASRLRVIDGGYRENPEVELYVVAQGTCPPTPSPTIDPRDVKRKLTKWGQAFCDFL